MSKPPGRSGGRAEGLCGGSGALPASSLQESTARASGIGHCKGKYLQTALPRGPGGLLLNSPTRRGAQWGPEPIGDGDAPRHPAQRTWGCHSRTGPWQRHCACPWHSAPALPRITGSRGLPDLCVSAPELWLQTFPPPGMLLLLNPLPTSPPQAQINSFQSLLAGPWPGCINPLAA